MPRPDRRAARREAAAGADAVRTTARGRQPEETPFEPVPATDPDAPVRVEETPFEPGTAANPDAPVRVEETPFEPGTAANPDAPVRVEVAMPRHLFDRLTDRDDAPRCRYDVATGRAEFVAEPTFAHESRGVIVGELFMRIMDALEDTGSPLEIAPARATRLLSDDGAFEPDEGLFVGAAKIRAAEGIDEWFDVRRGHPIPDLVAEIDRSTASRHKLGPYFRMGVREAWTWSRRSGTALWVADPRTADGFRRADASVVLPGLSRDALHGLLESRAGARRRREMRRLAGIVAPALAGNPPGA